MGWAFTLMWFSLMTVAVAAAGVTYWITSSHFRIKELERRIEGLEQATHESAR